MTKTRHSSIVSICALFVLAAIAISITACTSRRQAHTDANGTMNVEFGENGTIRNGMEYASYQVKEGQKGMISIRISRESGRLDVEIYPVDSKDHPNYTGRDLDSTSFDVIVEEPVEYQVCFTAAEFVGDYGITWSIEDAAGKEAGFAHRGAFESEKEINRNGESV